MVLGFRVPASNKNEMTSRAAAAMISPQDQWTELTFASPRMLRRRPIFGTRACYNSLTPGSMATIHICASSGCFEGDRFSVPTFVSMMAVTAVVVSASSCNISCYALAAVPTIGTDCSCHSVRNSVPVTALLVLNAEEIVGKDHPSVAECRDLS